MGASLKAAIEAAPKTNVLWRKVWLQYVLLRGPFVQWIDKLVVVGHQVAPERVGLLPQPQLRSLRLVIADEGSILTSVDVLVDSDQVPLVELKCLGKHVSHLPNCVQELQENWADLVGVGLNLATTILKFVPKGQPVLFNECLEPLNCAVGAVQHETSERASLRRSIPTV
jgi:hypothetical protein